jgi:hypothetical protein
MIAGISMVMRAKEDKMKKSGWKRAREKIIN